MIKNKKNSLEITFPHRSFVSIRNTFFLSFILLLPIAALSGLDRKTVRIPVDNEHIQRYNGLLGRWIVPGNTSMEEIARRMGTTVSRIHEVNGNQVSQHEFVFVPMSRETYDNLLASGLGRRIYELDSRKMVWPVEDPGYTSRYGKRGNRMHEGLDIGCARGTIIYAAEKGVVEKSRWYGAMGKTIVLRHENGLQTWYGHNSSLLVKEGDVIEKGQIISYSGNTGRSTGPHLHFEVRYNHISMNPEDFLPYGYTNPELVIREGLVDTTVARSEQEKKVGEPLVVEMDITTRFPDGFVDPATENN